MSDLMNERKKKNVDSNEAHLLLSIVVIRTIIKIENIFFINYCYLRFQCFSGTHVNVVSIDK